jgi:hypothetical protein
MSNPQKRKGSDFERLVAKLFANAFDCQAMKRTPNSGGLDIKGDLRAVHGPYCRECKYRNSCPVDSFVVEAKKQEHMNIWACIQQAKRQATGGKKWCLIFSRNKEGVYVTLDIQDWFELLLEASKTHDESSQHSIGGSLHPGAGGNRMPIPDGQSYPV